MAINNGDFVRLNFTGKIQENDEIFDTTFEDVAKEANLFNENKEYKPIPIIVGGKSFRLCDDINEVENAIIFYMDNIIQNEKGFKLITNLKNNENFELIVEINIINQNIKFVIQLEYRYKAFYF